MMPHRLESGHADLGMDQLDSVMRRRARRPGYRYAANARDVWTSLVQILMHDGCLHAEFAASHLVAKLVPRIEAARQRRILALAASMRDYRSNASRHASPVQAPDTQSHGQPILAANGSRARIRSPAGAGRPSGCSESSTTSPHSANLNSGRSAKRRKPSSACSPAMACPRAQKWNRAGTAASASPRRDGAPGTPR